MSESSSSSDNKVDLEDGLEKVPQCLFCGSDKFAREYENVLDLFFSADLGNFTYLRCQGCQSLWLENRPVGARLAKAYSSYYTHSAPRPTTNRKGLHGLRWSGYVRSRFAAKSSLLDDMIAKISELAGLDNSYIEEKHRFAPKAPAKILDYGCGSGEYLLVMQSLGYSVEGAEFDPHLLTDLAQRGIKIADVAAIDDNQWQNEFDHITLSHVLEHVPNPLALLHRLFAWLKPGGTLFVEVPSADATGLEIFGTYWRGLEAPRHFSLPSRVAMIAALEQSGFVLDRQQISITARPLVWDISVSAVPESDSPRFKAAMAAAPSETLTNAEFLTFVARRPN